MSIVLLVFLFFFFFFQAEDGIRDLTVTGVQTCALPILTISTGTGPGWEASAPRFPQTIDRVAIGAKRLRTRNGLGVWTWRAGSVARRTRPGFVWCDEVKPAGYPATWLHARGGPPFGVIAHGAAFLLLEAKI